MRNQPFTFLVALAGATLLATLASQVVPLAAQNGSGKQIFEKRCTGCHALDNEKTGPHLRGVYGRTAASLATFPYSESLRKSALQWNSSTLDKWLTDPDSLVPDNDMGFRSRMPRNAQLLLGTSSRYPTNSEGPHNESVSLMLADKGSERCFCHTLSPFASLSLIPTFNLPSR